MRCGAQEAQPCTAVLSLSGEGAEALIGIVLVLGQVGARELGQRHASGKPARRAGQPQVQLARQPQTSSAIRSSRTEDGAAAFRPVSLIQRRISWRTRHVVWLLTRSIVTVTQPALRMPVLDAGIAPCAFTEPMAARSANCPALPGSMPARSRRRSAVSCSSRSGVMSAAGIELASSGNGSAEVSLPQRPRCRPGAGENPVPRAADDKQPGNDMPDDRQAAWASASRPPGVCYRLLSWARCCIGSPSIKSFGWPAIAPTVALWTTKTANTWRRLCACWAKLTIQRHQTALRRRA